MCEVVCKLFPPIVLGGLCMKAYETRGSGDAGTRLAYHVLRVPLSHPSCKVEGIGNFPKELVSFRYVLTYRCTLPPVNACFSTRNRIETPNSIKIQMLPGSRVVRQTAEIRSSGLAAQPLPPPNSTCRNRSCPR